MKLTSISYREFFGEPREWKLEKVLLGDVNLLVGRNATGKTRTLNIINALSNLISGQQRGLTDGEWVCEFESDEDRYKYKLRIKGHLVASERLERVRKNKKKILLKRGKNGAGRIWFERGRKEDDFHSPPDQIAMLARRDEIQHSFFIPFVEWGKSTFHIPFGRNLGEHAFVIENKDYAQSLWSNPGDQSAIAGTFLRGKKIIGKDFVSNIILDMKEVGYPISKVDLDTPEGITVKQPLPGKLLALYVKEKDLKCRTEQISISDGMFAALNAIIQINYRIMTETPSCFLIDDIGEGLDFERACSLIDVLTKKARKSSAQLLMSTNDRFVMNRVPIDEWTVLKRSGSLVKGFNIHNSKRKFEKFRFTGLNNFDLFATNYLFANDKK